MDGLKFQNGGQPRRKLKGRFGHRDPFEYEYEYRCTEYEYDFPDERIANYPGVFTGIVCALNCDTSLLCVARLRLQVSLENRFEDNHRGHLHDTIFDRWNSQRSLFSIGFGNPHTTDRTHVISFPPEFFRQFVQPTAAFPRELAGSAEASMLRKKLPVAD